MMKKNGQANDASNQTETINPIQVKELTKQFAEQLVVDRVSFEIPPATVFGFIGPSGCGKTTTVRMLTGIYHPTSGEAKVIGQNPGKSKKPP